MHATAKPWYRDWTQWVCPGPTRRFSADELTRGGQQPWPVGVDAYVFANLAVLAVLNYRELPARWAPGLLIAILLMGWWAIQVARWLWRSPSRRRLNWAIFGGAAAMVLLSLVLVRGLGHAESKLPFILLLALWVMASAAWWFLALYRSEQIEARLKELDAQDEQLRLTRRLATAQIHPHFVFNTLASLTQWVETQDPRAGPLLQDFNAYLRATLPMFERESQPLREELELVRRYLAIMQARLGERLHWTVDHDPALDALPLPPGSLLTLVENAITHGIEPALRGGSIALRTLRTEGGLAELRVSDSGVGLDEGTPEGLGLRNTRARLQALAGPTAQLLLRPLQLQGCEARMLLPMPCTSTPAC